MSIESVSVKNGRELEQKLMHEIDTIEKGLTLICNNVPIDEKTQLDVLCHDENRCLVILKLSIGENDDILFQGIRCLDYVNKIKPVLKATYGKSKLNETKPPRLILLAPNFSEALISIVKHMEGIQIDLYRWEFLKLGTQEGLYLQHIPVHARQPKPVTPAESKSPTPPVEKEEPQEKPKERKPKPPQPMKRPKIKSEEPKKEIETPPPTEKEEVPPFKKEEKKPSGEHQPKKKLKLF